VRHCWPLLIPLAVACRSPTLPDASSVTPVIVARLPTFLEGVVFDRHGVAYVSELWSETIWRIGPGEVPTRWASVANPNGHRILPDGRHVVCAFGADAIAILDSVGRTLTLVGASDAGPLRDPNDLFADEHGGLYFTDSVDSTGTVNYLAPNGRAITLVGRLRYPNGIVLRPDGRTLLVTEFVTRRILAYRVLAPGRLGPAEVFTTMPPPPADSLSFSGPDGMALDEAGNLYVAYYGAGEVVVFSPSGALLRRYGVGSPQASNVAFGGPRMDQLFVTSAESRIDSTQGILVRLDLPGVAGLPILPAPGAGTTTVGPARRDKRRLRPGHQAVARPSRRD